MEEKAETKYAEVPQHEEHASKDKDQPEGGAIRLQAKMSLINGKSLKGVNYCIHIFNISIINLKGVTVIVGSIIGSNWKCEYGFDRLDCLGLACIYF